MTYVPASQEDEWDRPGAEFSDLTAVLAADPTYHLRLEACLTCPEWTPGPCTALPPEASEFRGFDPQDVPLPGFCPERDDDDPAGEFPVGELGAVIAAIARANRRHMKRSDLFARVRVEAASAGLALKATQLEQAIPAARAAGLRQLGTRDYTALPRIQDDHRRRDELRRARATLSRIAEQHSAPLPPPLDLLLADARHVNLLTPREEVELSKRIDRGDIEARNRMVEANLRLVVSIVRSYRGCGLPLSDLVQEGTLGLIRAAEKFDHRKGFRFSTYASWWIRQSASRGVADRGRVIRLPVHIWERVNRLAAAERNYAEAGRDEVPAKEIASAASLTVDELRDLRASLEQEPITLDETVGRESVFGVEGDGEELLEVAFEGARAEALGRSLAMLSQREQVVIRRRYGIGLPSGTLDEIGREMGVTRERIRQVEGVAKRKLRRLAPLQTVVGAEDEDEDEEPGRARGGRQPATSTSHLPVLRSGLQAAPGIIAGVCLEIARRRDRGLNRLEYAKNQRPFSLEDVLVDMRAELDELPDHLDPVSRLVWGFVYKVFIVGGPRNDEFFKKPPPVMNAIPPFSGGVQGATPALWWTAWDGPAVLMKVPKVPPILLGKGQGKFNDSVAAMQSLADAIAPRLTLLVQASGGVGPEDPEQEGGVPPRSRNSRQPSRDAREQEGG